MPARHKQIGEGTGHEQAMSVRFEPAIAHFGKAKHSLDDPDRMLDFGPTFDLVRSFARSTLSTTPRWAIAPVDEVFRSRCVPHTRVSFPCNRSGNTVLSATLAGVAGTAW